MIDEDLKPYLDEVPVLIIRAEDFGNPLTRWRIDRQVILLRNAIMTAHMKEALRIMEGAYNEDICADDQVL